jgi:hypothetical protein
MGWTLLEPGVYLRVSDANTAEVLVGFFTACW